MEMDDKLLSVPEDGLRGFTSKLMSPNKQKREKAMSLICLWLSCRTEVKEDEICGIWKQLFCCVRVAEKASLFQDLICWFTLPIEKLDIELSILVFRALWTTLRAEWTAMDSQHVDKFHLLIKQCIIRMFTVLQKHAWDALIIEKFMDALVDRFLLAEDGCVSNGVNHSITDVYLEEMKHFFPISGKTFDLLLRPFWMVLASGSDYTFGERVRDKVFLSLCQEGYSLLKARELNQQFDQTDEYTGFLVLSAQISTTATNLISSSAMSERNSMQLHDVQQKFDDLKRFAAQSALKGLLDVEGHVFCPGADSSPKEDLELDSSVGLASPFANLRDSGGQCTIKSWPAPSSHPNADRDNLHVNNENVPPLNDCTGNLCKESSKKNFLGGEVDKMCLFEKKDKHTKDRVFGVLKPSDKNMSEAPFMLECEENGMDKTLKEIGSFNGLCLEGRTAVLCEEDVKTPNAVKENSLLLDDFIISNLAERFDSIADDPEYSQLDNEVSLPIISTPVSCTVKKRKSWRCLPAPLSTVDCPFVYDEENSSLSPDCMAVNSSSTNMVKKVRFSLKHNIVWRPSTPLPPHSLRVPPSATPRGSALKKGVPPGSVLVMTELSPASVKKRKTARRTPLSTSRSKKTVKTSKKGRLSLS